MSGEKDITIITLMKAVVNCTEPMTEREQTDFLDTIDSMLRRRRARKRMNELRRIFNRGK